MKPLAQPTQAVRSTSPTGRVWLERVRGPFLVAAAGIIWGTIGVTGKTIFSYGLDPLLVASVRLSIAFAILLVWNLAFNRRLLRVSRGDMPLLLSYGLVSMGLYTVLYMSAIRLTTASQAVVLLYTAPFFTVAASRLVFGEPIGGWKAAGLAFAVAGVFMCAGGLGAFSQGTSLAGVLCGLGSGMTYGLFGVFGKRSIERHDYRTVLTYAVGFGAAGLTAVRPPWAVLGYGLPAAGWAALIYLGAGPTVLSFCLYHIGLEHTAPGAASIIATIEVVVGLILGRVVLGELLTPPQIAGAVLVIAGIAAVQLATPGRRTTSP